MMAKAFLVLTLLLALESQAGANQSEQEEAYHKCTGKSVKVRFFGRSDVACVRWPEGATVGDLVEVLQVHSGAWSNVQLIRRNPNRWRRPVGVEKRLRAEVPLDSFIGSTLEASTGEEENPGSLSSKFLYLLPKVSIFNLPLLRIERWALLESIDEIKRILRGSPTVTASWLRFRDDSSLDLFEPSNETISQIFPARNFRRVELRDAERGLLKHFPSKIFSFPRVTNVVYCSTEAPLVISPLGMKQIKATLRSRGAVPEIAMLLIRRAQDVEVEQDPTLMLMRIFRGSQNVATFHQVAIHTEMSETPFLSSPDSTQLADYSRIRAARNLSLLESALAHRSQFRHTSEYEQIFAATSNIDMEEAFSVVQSLSPGKLDFGSMQSFYTRPISYEVLRPIDSRAVLVAPADSAVKNAFYVKPNAAGQVIDTRIPQIKGTTFRLSTFLFGSGSNVDIKLKSPNNRLYVGIYYLMASDYHRFHSAADWKATDHVHIPGFVPSVDKPETMNRNVLDSMERISVHGHWSPGNRGGPRLFFSMTFVAGTNVGGITLFYRRHVDADKMSAFPVSLNSNSSNPSVVHEYTEPVNLCMGQEMGQFNYGSTVVLVFEAPQEFELHAPICEHVDVNSTAGTLRGQPRQLLPRCKFTYGNYDSPVKYLSYLQSLSKTVGSAAPLEEPSGQTLTEDTANEAIPLFGATALRLLQRLARMALQGSDAGEAPMATFDSKRDSQQRPATLKIVEGDETHVSSLKDLEDKIVTIEYGLVNRFALAAYLNLQWTRNRFYQDHLVIIQVGRLGPNGNDSSGSSLPLCSLDISEGVMLLRFQGQWSNMLLEVPVDNRDPLFTEHPFYACASNNSWGKVTRGISASWRFFQNNLLVTFRVMASKKINDLNERAVCRDSFAFHTIPVNTMGTRIHLGRSNLSSPDASSSSSSWIDRITWLFGEDSEKAAKAVQTDIRHFALSRRIVSCVEPESFVITRKREPLMDATSD